MARIGKDWLLLLRNHRRPAFAAFVFGVFVWLSLGEIYPKHYSGSATLAVNPLYASLSQPAPDPLPVPAAENQTSYTAALIRRVAAQQDWTGIVTRFHLYPEMTRNGEISRAASELASQISLQPVPGPDLKSDAVLITYTGTDLTQVLGVTTAITDGFTKAAGNVKAKSASNSDSLYAPVILPTIEPFAEPGSTQHRQRNLPLANSPQSNSSSNSNGASIAVLSNKLQSSLARGVTLQQALDQNTATLTELQQELQAARHKNEVASQPPQPPVEIKPDPQEERLHQELTRAQQELAQLRDRYTDEYPDVVAARHKVQDLQLDISRIAAIAPRPTKASVTAQASAEAHAAAAKAAAAELEQISTQIAQAQSAQDNLQESLQQDQQETTRLQAGLAAARRSDGAARPADHNNDARPAPEHLNANATTHLSPDPGAVAGDSSSLGSSPFILVQRASITTRPAIFAIELLLPLSLVFGILVAFFAAWFAERRDPSIRDEGMLRHELPASAMYLGGIPRIRHEVIAE
ncbi:hypothetical protein ACPOL_2484 [Acidisarcina polymorpha]|uniref:Uncharacterized protein n=1 Tax=Acidisarcina polymorpha TaxID=2211140 RepID=A0A2Z5FZK9_9BACT|nr:hypothetical protein ACPOL_2484 [Acidisarcina polymorpha]